MHVYGPNLDNTATGPDAHPERAGAGLSGLFFRLVGVAEDLLANDPFSRLVQVLVERLPDLEEFWPESVVDE